MGLLDMEHAGIGQISHSTGHGSILIMRITHPEVCQIVRRDLIAMGWGWRAVNDSRGTRHEDETRLFLPEETAIEYLLNTALPRAEILLQQARNIIRDNMAEDGSYGLYEPRPSARDFLPPHAEDDTTETLEADDEFSVQAGKQTPIQRKWIEVTGRLRRVLMSAPLLIALITLNFPLIVKLITSGVLVTAILWGLTPCVSLAWMYWKQKSRG